MGGSLVSGKTHFHFFMSHKANTNSKKKTGSSKWKSFVSSCFECSADFLCVRDLFIYLNVVLSFYSSVWKLKWCDVKDPTVVKLRLIAELWAGEFIPPCIHFVRRFHFRLIFIIIVGHFTLVSVQNEWENAYMRRRRSAKWNSASGLDHKCSYKGKIVAQCNLSWTEPGYNGNLSLEKKLLEPQWSGVLRSQNLSTCMKRNVSATEKIS
jgi:hypothetical protein